MSTSASQHSSEARNRATDRSHNQGRQDRSYTPAQVAAVNRVRKCRVDDYYAILDIEKPGSEAEIRKSYRKLALIMHPDKNGAPGADEAFKMVSKAFQILSDSDKKHIYDHTGQDPDSRQPSMSSSSSARSRASPFGGFGASAGRAGPGGMFEGEMSPEDLFNIFFGHAGGPSNFQQFSFGGGPGIFTFSPGRGATMRNARAGQGGRSSARAGSGNADASGPRAVLLEVLPLIILFGLPLLFSLFGDSTASNSIKYNFQQEEPFTVEKFTQRYHIPYYVKPDDVEDLPERKLKKLGEDAEISYVRTMKKRCHDEYNYRARKIAEAEGWFFNDQEAYQKALDLPMYSCEVLDRLGVSRNLM